MTLYRSLFYALVLLSLQLGSCVGISAAMAEAAADAARNSVTIGIMQ